MAAAPQHKPPHTISLIPAGTTSNELVTKVEQAPFGSSDLLPLFLGALSVVLLILLGRRNQGAGLSSWFRGFPKLIFRRQRLHPHLPPRPFLPPSPHRQLHDEKYLSRILEADRLPPHP
jgi:hypothetical protein